MAISNYTELRAAVAAWTHRTDLTSVIPDFIALAEDEFNQRLRLAGQEAFDELTCTARLTDLPSDFLELRSAEYQGLPLTLIAYGTPEYLTIAQDGSTGTPRAYSLRGTQIELFPAPSSVTLNITYWAKVPALSDSNGTNFLLTLHPSLYLTAAKKWAAIYMRDAELASGMAQLLENLLVAAETADARKRHAGPLAVRVA